MTLQVVDLRMRPQASAVAPHLGLTVRSGAVTLVVGPTGSGKTTLLSVLAGLIPPASGQVLYDGVPLWSRGKVNPAVVRRIGVVFQQPERQLFARSVRGEFAYSLRPYPLTPQEQQRRTAAYAQSFAVAERLESFPLTLSGGEQRRVALATTWATEPDWLFLDEPTAGLDPQGVHEFVELIHTAKSRLGNRGGIVIATHDLDHLLPVADVVIMIRDGQVLREDTPDALCQDPGCFAAAGIGVPSCVAVATAMSAAGWPLPRTPLSVEEMADILAACWTERNHRAVCTESASAVGADRLHEVEPTVASREQTPPALDIRAKWLALTLFGAGIFLQHNWVGIIVAGGIVFALMKLVRMRWRDVPGLRGYLWLTAISAGLAGLRFGPDQGLVGLRGIGFASGPAAATLLSLVRILLVIALGAVFSKTTSPLQIQQGIEHLFMRVKRFRRPFEALALAAGITIRMIPVVAREWEKLSLIVRARGKAHVRPGRVRVRDLPAVAIPLTVSVLQLADAVATALAARGYREFGRIRTRPPAQPWRRADYLATGMSGVAFLVLWWLHSV